ncbi:vacuolar protein sorting-associated protein VTA1 homolog [Osmia bicornis bicornis]|uniref:vacuolar protein sorting-associated protein VTA1 homolog n=1 Tax=Osmia bicornis bicornis TaxID=1437191 RepID=UPI0010F44F71|nr:vacuolar protein sorting-associated protein VTA1 homolog [Osmia bicornis bicornis]
MVGPDLPEIPASLKTIQQYLKIAATHDQRDPVVSYWCRLYALQTGLKLSTKSPKETNFLMKLMDWLETTKKELRDNEAITNDVAAQAHLENWALKLFLYADKNDREGNFGKNIIQSFFTAGLLYDVLTTFGELTEEAAQNRKYAKWKAAYIHNCLKNNETPVPGPMPDDAENVDFDSNASPDSGETTTKPKGDETSSRSNELIDIHDNDSSSEVPDRSNKGNIGQWSSEDKDYNVAMKTEGGVDLSVEDISKAQKLIKWAGSALNYDDVPTAILNLQKALCLLRTGQEEA